MDKIILFLFFLICAMAAHGQTLPNLPEASLPLAGNELLYIVQNGQDRKAPLSTIEEAGCSAGSCVVSFNGRNGVVTLRLADVASVLYSGSLFSGDLPEFSGTAGLMVDSGKAASAVLTANQTITLSGDCTGSGTTAIAATCLKTNGTAFSALATASFGTSAGTALQGSQLFISQSGYSWASTVTVANGTIILNPAFAWSAGTIVSVTVATNGTGTPSFTADVQIGGASMAGCNAISVSSATPASTTCTGSNTLTAGSLITLVISSVSGSPDEAAVFIKITHPII